MPLPHTLSQRFRARLRERLRQSPRGTQSKLGVFCDRPPSWVSMLLADDRQPKLDDLDAIARFFRISVSELLGVTKPGELSGDEQRVVYAYRALPPAVQEHFVALIELASVRASHAFTLTATEHGIIETLRQQPEMLASITQVLGLHRQVAHAHK